ncbi:MAG TPA: alpha-2-macroglobulin family protein, partial [Gemmatimonadales bacterium]
LPAGLEGNGYVSVSYVRDVNSEEVFTTPLSFGVAPFSVSLEQRKTNITLETPQLVKPGSPFRVHYTTSRPARIAVFAVDEGILQVAGYRTPDPLGFFFEKRALEVRTSQILDLILPEFAQLMAASAPGGDAEGMLGRNLNPFKRRRDPPVAFWSGVRDAGPDGADFTFTVPDYFNGTLRVMAVAVNDETVGATATKSLVRGDFVLSPNVPLMVAPGDTFEVSVGVANNIQNSGTGAQVQVALQVPANLEIIGAANTTLPIDAMREGSTTFRLRAKEGLGNATLTFTSRLGDKSARIAASLSLRPAVPFRTSLAVGSVTGGKATAAVDRTLHTELRTVNAGISVVPLGIARGLAEYLRKYPYGCTEQLVSQGVPAMVLSRRAEFGISGGEATRAVASVLDQLRGRQNEEGAYGLWAANTHVDDYVSVYAQHFLLDARERNFAVPQEVITLGQRYLQQLAASEGSTLAEERTRAYAIYLLTRQGVVTTGVAMSLDRRVRARYPNEWKGDLTGAFLAATYQLLRQDARANEIMGAIGFGKRRTADYGVYDDALTHDAMLLYLVSRHFPDRLPDLRAGAIEAIVGPISHGAYNTLSTA